MLARKANESLSSLSIRILSPNFVDPQDGLLSNDGVHSELKKLREDILRSDYVLNLGNLAEFVR